MSATIYIISTQHVIHAQFVHKILKISTPGFQNEILKWQKQLHHINW